jgi:hypothetical protein
VDGTLRADERLQLLANANAAWTRLRGCNGREGGALAGGECRGE